PVGGIKDKVLAAYRAGIRTIILSAENDRDLDDLPEEIRNEMDFHRVFNMDEVIKVALEGVPSAATSLPSDGKPAAEGGTVAACRKEARRPERPAGSLEVPSPARPRFERKARGGRAGASRCGAPAGGPAGDTGARGRRGGPVERRKVEPVEPAPRPRGR